MFLDASGTMARRRRLYQPFRSMFLCASPKFLSIGAPVVLSRLKDSSTMLFSGESQIVTLVAFDACCASPARRSFPTSPSIFSWESTRPNLFLQSLRGQASTGDTSLSCSILSILHVWPPPLFRSVNLGMKRPPEDSYRQPPQTYLLSRWFANLAFNVGRNPLRCPDLSHQKLVRPCCRRTTLTSSYVVEITSLPCFLFKN
ncbi:hypothetical protein DY000_02037963 [Brassica cretica]|uniref:Uncharacterized protein n=1 Tax=Brassica cretica TaxID=69181 RepID=A0ABQ7BI46_BRACR|nr:hypothetical protein DY000_02037963 [Brassica cretica]